jgi:hypothetical protein
MLRKPRDQKGASPDLLGLPELPSCKRPIYLPKDPQGALEPRRAA